jgi:solute carrier family 13 (sodium-dependent dicarboxylate transporter), member 2/3/5
LSTFTAKQFIGLWFGLIGFLAILIIPAPESLDPVAWRTLAVAFLMASWWITEAIPIAVTSLLPIVLLPVLGIQSISQSTTPYANPLIFLFMGGFMVAIAMQRWNLHKRIALNIVSYVGTKPSSILIGFIIASAFLSMWVSNSATALMMLPIALSIIEIAKKDNTDKADSSDNFILVLVLCIAYACNIGGIGTLIGTPPNALAAGFVLDTYGYDISFVKWMMGGIPLVLVGLPAMYLILSKLIYPVYLKELPGGVQLIAQELKKLGDLSIAEKRVAMVFAVTAFFWIVRPLIGYLIPEISDAGIAIAAGISLFLIPSGDEKPGTLVSWDDVSNLPWGILILFGGGLSLASAITSSGLADWIGQEISTLGFLPVLLMLLIVTSVIVFLTEMTSNTATAAAFIPILGSAAIGLGYDPLFFVIPAAIAASCAFMLPVATPPNAIVYASDEVTIGEMSKAGIWLNIAFITLITLAAYTIIAWVYGFSI